LSPPPSRRPATAPPSPRAPRTAPTPWPLTPVPTAPRSSPTTAASAPATSLPSCCGRLFEMTEKLSHYDEAGQAHMVDVSGKAPTARQAVAEAFVELSEAVLDALPQNPKGNPLEVARFAGIQAAKKTADLIPMCHPL